MSTNKVYGDALNELQLVELPTRFDYADSARHQGIDETMRIDQSKYSLFGASKVAAGDAAVPALPPSTETPPLVTADSRPVKELPDDPGGKDFPQKNKLTYDRLQNGDEPEAERLVPVQENVAVPASPPSSETAGMPASVATTDLARPTTQAVGGAEPVAVASADNSLPDGGPREVKTMVVRPMVPWRRRRSRPRRDRKRSPHCRLLRCPRRPRRSPPPSLPRGPLPRRLRRRRQPPAARPVCSCGSARRRTRPTRSRLRRHAAEIPDAARHYRPMVQKADLGVKGTWYRLASARSPTRPPPPSFAAS